MRAKITSTSVVQLRPGPSPYEVHDVDLRGFLVRVQPSGAVSYYCSFRTKDGRRNRLSLGRHPGVTAVQARDHAKRTIALVVQGFDPAGDKKKVKSGSLTKFLDDEYLPYVKARHRDGGTTVDRIKGSFKGFLASNLDVITAPQIERWRAKRVDAGLAVASINRDLATLKAALTLAVAWGHIKENPLAKVKLARLDSTGVVRYLSNVEGPRLEAALDRRDESARSERDRANEWRRGRGYAELPDLRSIKFVDHLRPMIIISRNTGLRRGELFNLSWSDVDMTRKNLTVRAALAKSGNTRHIPMNEHVVGCLKAWKKQASSADGLVFPSQSGKAFDNVQKAWSTLLKSAEIENFRFHDMRHDFASRLVMAGVGLNDVRELLGHADLKMTLRYAHLSQEHKASAVAKLTAI